MTVYDPELLVTLLAVEQTGSFTQAAARLGVRQPTVSQHIRRLEQQAGRTLILRDTRSVTLTADGEAMIGLARTIIAAHERAAAYFSGSRPRGRLRIGMSDDLALTRLPQILRDFRREYPLVDFDLTVDQSGLLHQRLEEDRLDVFVGRRPRGAERGRLVRRGTAGLGRYGGHQARPDQAGPAGGLSGAEPVPDGDAPGTQPCRRSSRPCCPAAPARWPRRTTAADTIQSHVTFTLEALVYRAPTASKEACDKVKTSNPVLSRLGEAAAAQRAAGYPAGPAYGEPYPATTYPAAPPTVRPMTIDDVVVRTVGLLGLTGVTGAVAWAITPDSAVGGFAFAAAMVGLVLGLIISFANITNPFVIGAYAVIEGVFVGLISKAMENWYDGIVLQAAAATFGIFFVMAMLYKARVIRATPRFVRGMIAAIVGVFAIIMINLLLSLFGVNTHLRDGSGLAIVFSLVVIVIASLSFILNFAEIENGVRHGLPQKYAWTCAFGLLVGLIWVYLEVLRLLSYLQGRD